MKIVIDTNLMISAMYFGGKPKKLVDLLVRGSLDAYADSEIIQEYTEASVEFADDHEDQKAIISLSDIVPKLHQIEVTTEVHVCRDPDDDKFIACAVDSKSKYIVSGDKDLLSLGSHEDVEIVTVADFLRDNFPNA